LNKQAPCLQKKSPSKPATALATTHDFTDRFIPLRMKDTFQAKFEAISLNTTQLMKHKTQENVPQNSQ
jgi:hypothetical protein